VKKRLRVERALEIADCQTAANDEKRPVPEAAEKKLQRRVSEKKGVTIKFGESGKGSKRERGGRAWGIRRVGLDCGKLERTVTLKTQGGKLEHGPQTKPYQRTKRKRQSPKDQKYLVAREAKE